jgi:hypothetical protein
MIHIHVPDVCVGLAHANKDDWLARGEDQGESSADLGGGWARGVSAEHKSAAEC